MVRGRARADAERAAAEAAERLLRAGQLLRKAPTTLDLRAVYRTDQSVNDSAYRARWARGQCAAEPGVAPPNEKRPWKHRLVNRATSRPWDRPWQGGRPPRCRPAALIDVAMSRIAGPHPSLVRQPFQRYETRYLW
ncbi:hypothetical protein [Streptomyces bugieae]|uniref:Uncharacterized protein n=1 Tax=Streptomyces bugieae TaxID=3098223 RepID=A0ABU7NVC2_9ACTN|nr:hypothetical protein [Streptomyces sp. DSM 41528]